VTRACSTASASRPETPGRRGEYPAWFFLAGERFEGARQMERDALVIVVGDLKLIVEPLDEPE
jgi:hypothetical protein